MVRKSSRLQNKAISYTEAEEIDSEEAEDYDPATEDIDETLAEDYKPATKRRKKSHISSSHSKKSRRKRGLLSQLTEFPLDVLFEIFGHLHPYDLLRLSRTTKDLRNILMSKSSAFVWRTALGNVDGLPDLPSELNEPQFVHLAFDNRCHFCSAPNIKRAQWSILKRYCKRCLDNPNLFATSLSYEQRILEFYLPKIEIKNGYYVFRGRKYYLPAVHNLLEQYNAVKDDVVAITAWTQERVAAVKEVEKYALICWNWEDSRHHNRSLELDEIRERRQADIVAKVVGLGYQPEIDYLEKHDLDVLSSHKLVHVAKDLTDRGWINIRTEIVELMEELREQRLEFELNATWSARRAVVVGVINNYLSSLPHNSIHPSKGCISNMDVFRTIYLDTPLEEKLTPEHFNEAVLQIPEYTNEWRAAKDQELVELIKIQRSDFSVSDLSLATTVFKCGNCTSPRAIRYPDILVHDHEWLSNQLEPTENMHLHQLWNTLSFYKQRWEYCREYSEAMATAIREYGFNPNTVTTAEMDALNPFFECARPRGESYSGRLVVRWCSLTRHITVCQDWKLLDISNVGTAEAKEEEGNRFQMFGCKHCNKRTHKCDLDTHIRSEHGKTIITAEDRVCLIGSYPDAIRMLTKSFQTETV